MTETDRIVKTAVLRAPRQRVWRAISDAAQFGIWFGAELEGPFVAGARVTGRMRPTQVDSEVAKHQASFAGMAFECAIERVEPPRLLAFRWHPEPPAPGTEFSAAPTTLVTFELEEVAEGTKLTITESGFDQIPLERRAKMAADNGEGWATQLLLVEKYLAREGVGAGSGGAGSGVPVSGSR